MRIPCVILSVCASKFLYPLSKDSQWETAKSGYKNADGYVYMVRVTRPALMLSCKIRMGRDNGFDWTCLQSNCAISQEISGCGNFENCHGFFIFGKGAYAGDRV